MKQASVGLIVVILLSSIAQSQSQRVAYVNCRSKQSVQFVSARSSTVGDSLACGEQVTIIGEDDTKMWVKVRTRDKGDGYVSAVYLSLTNPYAHNPPKTAPAPPMPEASAQAAVAPENDARTPMAEPPAGFVSSRSPTFATRTPDPPSILKVPTTPGLYWRVADVVTRLEGRAVTFERTGSLLASGLTVGIISRKGNAQLPGKTAAVKTSRDPVFYYRVPPAGEAMGAIGGQAGDLILVRLQTRRGRRQLEMGARGIARASAGPSVRWQLDFRRKLVEPGLYELQPSDILKAGEYAFYLFRGAEAPGYIYDFSVE